MQKTTITKLELDGGILIASYHHDSGALAYHLEIAVATPAEAPRREPSPPIIKPLAEHEALALVAIARTRGAPRL